VKQSKVLLLRCLKPRSETGSLIAVTAPHNYENRYIFCSLEERHPRYHFADDRANWEISISAGSGLGLRYFFGCTLCYCALSLIPETSAWDRGGYFDHLYQQPDKFLRKVNAVINDHFPYRKHKQRLEMQQLGVMDENFHLIPDPHVLKLAAQSDLYDG